MQTQDICGSLRDDRQKALRDSDKVSEQIRRCDTTSKDTLLAYGDYMPRLRTAIVALHRRKAFSQMPVGPVGHYVKIVGDDKWKAPVEGVISSVLQSFIVDNGNDRKVLSDLIRKEFPAHSRHSIITRKFNDTVYYVSGGCVEPVPNSFRVMDLIQCDVAIVMNCLIDSCRIERVLIVEEEPLAIMLTSDVENVPRNLLRVVLLNPATELYPAPNFRTYSSQKRYAKYLQVDQAQRKA